MRSRIVVVLTAMIALGLVAAPAAGQPPNDDFAAATAVAALPFFDAVDVSDATVEPGEPTEHCAPVANTVWYAVTLDESTEVAVDTAGSDFDTVLGVFTGTEVDNLDLVDCNDDVLFGLQSRVVFTAAAATTYWVQVGAFDELDEGGQLEIAFRRAGEVVCDAEVFPDDDEPFYLVAPGEVVECVASGLDTEEDAEWLVEFFTFLDEESEEPTATDGEAGLEPAADGTLSFAFVVPEDLTFGVFAGEVVQGEPGAETYLEPFGGAVLLFLDGPLTCAPDPAEPGDEVECDVEELFPEEFDWQVHILTHQQTDDLLGDDREIDRDRFAQLLEDEQFIELFFDPDVEGVGVADADGTGTFSFEIPADEEVGAYLVFVLQEPEFFAGYLGAFGIEEDFVEDADDDPRPRPVPRPIRVEAGGGGSVPPGGPPGLLFLLAGAAVIGIATTVRRVSAGR